MEKHSNNGTKLNKREVQLHVDTAFSTPSQKTENMENNSNGQLLKSRSNKLSVKTNHTSTNSNSCLKNNSPSVDNTKPSPKGCYGAYKQLDPNNHNRSQRNRRIGSSNVIDSKRGRKGGYRESGNY